MIKRKANCLRLRTKWYYLFFPYIIAAILSTLTMMFNYKMWEIPFSFKMPFGFNGDLMWFNAYVKNILNSNLFLQTKMLGAPFGTNYFNFPAMGAFDIFVIRLIGVFINDWAKVINIFYFFTFPFTAVIAVFAVKKMRINSIIAIFIGVLYSVLPYHFRRGQSHLNLSAYYFVPLIVLIIYLVYTETDSFCLKDSDGNKTINFKSTYFILCSIMSILIGMSVLYYAFFALLIMSISLVITYAMEKKSLLLKLLLSFICMIVITIFITMVPDFIYSALYENNQFPSGRSYNDFNLYSLSLTYLLLPVIEHRIAFLAKVTTEYIQNTRNVIPLTESTSSTLGLVASLGFILSFIFIFLNAKFLEKNKVIKLLSILNVFMFSIGTIAGFGFFIYLIFDKIRCYNRLSIVIGFFSLTIVGYLLQEFSKLFKNKTWYSIIVLVLLIIGVFDISPANYYGTIDQSNLKQDIENMEEFILRIEQLLPSDSMIYQLPDIGGSPQYKQLINNIPAYNHYLPYLYSDGLRWSYGARSNSLEHAWQESVSKLGYDSQIETLALVGFKGIYIDRFGYADEGLEIMTAFSDILAVMPIYSGDGRYVFYDLQPFYEAFQKEYTQEELSELESESMIVFNFGEGFSHLEGDEKWNWRWSDNKGLIEIFTTQEANFSFETYAYTHYAEDSVLTIICNDNTRVYKINENGTYIAETFMLSPGKSTIIFETDSRKVEAPNDLREMYFNLVNFKRTYIHDFID